MKKFKILNQANLKSSKNQEHSSKIDDHQVIFAAILQKMQGKVINCTFYLKYIAFYYIFLIWMPLLILIVNEFIIGIVAIRICMMILQTQNLWPKSFMHSQKQIFQQLQVSFL
ncbi:unnamed protein product [Paramecium pentaurelia]|uniref:Transmembrane protein n=1 Tax=Paramecium pentaurelia TaxID=43138 RepID=A0A8S1WWH6_9CILI|nr:unnamed protein product [Paramecium pentaurelia]CAD8192519.1 unnamed protein product [Paramecium pentaurelia]